MPGMGSTTNAVSVAERMLVVLKQDTDMCKGAQDDPKWFQDNVSQEQMAQIVKSKVITENWRREGRQALAIHPELVEEIKVATSDKIYPEVFRALPYINPMVVFPDPPLLKAWSRNAMSQRFGGGLTDAGQAILATTGKPPRPGKWMRLLGFTTYAHGVPDWMYRDIGVVVNTNTAEAAMLGMMLVFEVLDANKKVVDWEEISISLENHGDPHTLKEFALKTTHRFQWTDDMQGMEKEARKLLLESMQLCVGALLYLCSTVIEVERVPPKVVAKMTNRKIERRPLSLYRVGWTTGAALSRLRAERLRAAPSEQPDLRHQQQDPQHRKAHFKMQPYGPGRSLRRLTFISPYWTHRERLGEYGVNTARRVL
jgi:hypothetical protein